MRRQIHESDDGYLLVLCLPDHPFRQDCRQGRAIGHRQWSAGVCICNANIGIPIGFWEPVRQVDITRKPYCLVGLGGVEVGGGGGGLPADTPGYVSKPLVESEQQEAFFHAHYYMNPVMYYMELLLDDACIERKGFDLAYLTEADPTWVDDELNNLFNPDAFLYGNIAAVTACSADCIAATVGKPLNALYWCGGAMVRCILWWGEICITPAG